MPHECAMCGETEDWLYLHGRCHITAPTWVRLKDGVLEVLCVACGKLVGSFRLAGQDERGSPSVQMNDVLKALSDLSTTYYGGDEAAIKAGLDELMECYNKMLD